MHLTFLDLRRAARIAAGALVLAVAGATAAHAVKFTGGEYNTMYAGLGAKG